MAGTKKISLNNGADFITAKEAISEIKEHNLWDVVVNFMDDDVRELIHQALAPCSELEFLGRYLELAPCDLIIG